MEKRFIELTSGWIPVVVLLLFALALVAGNEEPAAAARIAAQGTSASVTPDGPAMIGALAPGAEEIVLAADERQAASTHLAEQ